MKCFDCLLKYVKQTDRAFRSRYKEHIQAFRSNNSNSEHLINILNTGHRYGTIINTMDIIRTHRKHLNQLEKYHIQDQKRYPANERQT
jgi:hypothetical protein